MGIFKPQLTHDTPYYKSPRQRGAEAFIKELCYSANPYGEGTAEWQLWNNGYCLEELDFKDVTPGYQIGDRG